MVGSPTVQCNKMCNSRSHALQQAQKSRLDGGLACGMAPWDYIRRLTVLW
jgi:hypothetical protein